MNGSVSRARRFAGGAALGAAIGLPVGRWLDLWLGTRPWFVVGGMVLGMVTGLIIQFSRMAMAPKAGS